MEVLAVVLSGAAVVIAMLSALFTRQQVVVAKASTRAQSLLSVVDYLQRTEIREARRTVLTTLVGHPLDKWTQEERGIASTVAASYDLVGTLLRDAVIPPRPILESYGASIIRCHEVCRPMVEEFRQGMSAELARSYWDDFDWLAIEAARTLGHSGSPSRGGVIDASEPEAGEGTRRA
ncbi:hypothetical protein [Microbacterium sp. Marseille-Q6648]|uniref:hypothetical protein n=1 Tax=Microbacterium sp. Marseille-Q6648 TaxID=2937991 RepID=UPI00203BF000|nr:hypothetical protein [Microbacterium sp. Marseille-Q6648]